MGREDKIPYLEIAELLHQKIQGSILKVIEGAGHCPHLEKPEEFNKALTEFLQKVNIFRDISL